MLWVILLRDVLKESKVISWIVKYLRRSEREEVEMLYVIGEVEKIVK